MLTGEEPEPEEWPLEPLEVPEPALELPPVELEFVLGVVVLALVVEAVLGVPLL